VLPKRYPSFISHTITTTSTVVCDDPATTKQNTGVCFCFVQLNNKQSINLITSLCWSYFQDETTFGYTYYTLSPKYPSFSSQRYRLQRSQQASQPKPTERTTSHYHYHIGESTRQQHSGNNKGNTTPVVVRTRMCRAYSTSPNLPRSGTLPNPNQSAARYSMYETNSYGQTYSIDQVVPHRLVTHSNPLSLHPGALDCF
jgi:hypothetical protein